MAMSSSTPRVTTTPTTTYPFAYTTYSTSHASSKFTTPTAIPSMFPFGPGFSCSASSSATPLPSNFPNAQPFGTKAACMISNDRAVNDHAFWDLYACCKSMDLTSGANANTCSAQCSAGEGQTWQELGECLSKRVDVVVCKPAAVEMGNGTSSSAAVVSSGRGTSTAASGQTSGVSGTRSASGQVSQATGAGGRNEVGSVGGSKMGAVVFVVLAAGSFAGMLL
jgi:hypothetical protein